MLAIDLVVQALLLSKDISNEDYTPASGNRTKPRMLISEGCDGWRAVIRHAHFILKLHGIETPWRRLYTLHGSEQINVTEGDPNQVTERAKQAWNNDTENEDDVSEKFVEESSTDDDGEGNDTEARDGVTALVHMGNATQGSPGLDLGIAMVKTYETFAAENKSLVFRASIKDINKAKSIMDLSLVARISRENKIDELVCRIKDCYDNKMLGYPVLDGEKSDLCWKHRNETQTDYKAFVKPSLFINNIEHLKTATMKSWKELEGMGYSGPSLEALRTEDLLDFEYDKEAVKRANSAWWTLLKAWGVRPNSTELMTYLKHHSGERSPPLSHRELIYNYDDIKAIIESHARFMWMLRE